MSSSILKIFSGLVGCSVQLVFAQPYHSDTTVGGVQTLKVEGDVSVEQYGSGSGGDLKVVGDAHVATGGISLPGMPSGVTGTYYGTQKLGTSVNVGEFVFEKTGDNTTGDFVVPLGVIGDWWNATIKLEIMTGPHDYDSGGAQYTIIPRRIPDMGGLMVSDHFAVGGGKGIKIHGKNYGMIHLYLEYDADHPWGGSRDHKVIVKMSTIGTIHPTERWHTFEEMTPVMLMESLTSDQPHGNEMTHRHRADSHVFDGKVVLSEPQGDISMGIYE